MHNHNHDHHHHSSDTQNIRLAFILNLVFTLIEIVGGFLTNSIAILSDALHDLGDSLSLGLAWYFQNISKKGRDGSYSYGYKRFSILGALINAVILLVGSIFILSEAIPRLLNPQTPNAFGMIWLAILGVVVNGAAVLQLKKGISINEKVISLHLLEDVLGWIAVLIGAVIMYFFEWPIIDPILSIGISAFIIYNVFKSLKKTTNIILQGIPNKTEFRKIESYLSRSNSVKDFHDLHIWSMDGQYNIMTVHLVTESPVAMQIQGELKDQIRGDLRKMGIEHATIEFEAKDHQCVFQDC